MTKREMKRYKKIAEERRCIYNEAVEMFKSTPELFEIAPDTAEQMLRDSIKESKI